MPLKSTVFARWKWLTGAVAAMVALLAIAAGVSAAGVSGTKAVSRPPTAASGFDDRPRAEIAAEALLLEVEPVGDFGFVLYDSARDGYLLSHRSDAVHFSQSIAKLLIAVSALQAGMDSAAVTEMLSRSDDWIASELWEQLDGPAVVEDQVEAMGLEHTAPAEEWVRWGDTLTSASDVVRVYEHLLEELPERERAIVFAALEGMADVGADGFDQTFDIPGAAVGRPWAVKQGWGCCKPDRFLVSTGTVGPDHRYIVAIFGAWDERQVDEAQAAAEMTALAEAVVGFIPGSV
ncbi:MAG TPA: hypothetical protein VKZ65_09960 [Glycomyces sp.]|nr:hypothetical protein [Glycomyces sp.]